MQLRHLIQDHPTPLLIYSLARPSYHLKMVQLASNKLPWSCMYYIFVALLHGHWKSKQRFLSTQEGVVDTAFPLSTKTAQIWNPSHSTTILIRKCDTPWCTVHTGFPLGLIYSSTELGQGPHKFVIRFKWSNLGQYTINSRAQARPLLICYYMEPFNPSIRQ